MRSDGMYDGMYDDEEPPPLVAMHTMQGIPDDAQRMGLDRHTQEGALVAMAGSLDSSKLSHRMVAWVMLAAMVLPLLLAIRAEFL